MGSTCTPRDRGGLRARAQARALGERLDDRALAAATIGVHALTEATLGRFALSSRGFAAGPRSSPQLPDQTLSSHLEATLLLGYAGYHLDRLDAVIGLVERGLAISRTSEQGQFYVPMLLLVALTRIERGELAAADALARDAEDVARLPTTASG